MPQLDRLIHLHQTLTSEKASYESALQDIRGEKDLFHARKDARPSVQLLLKSLDKVTTEIGLLERVEVEIPTVDTPTGLMLTARQILR